MLVCKACWDVFNYTNGNGNELEYCPKSKCMHNELDDICEVIIPTIKVLQKKGYFTGNCSACHFYYFGTALTPTCYIVFDEQIELADLPTLPPNFKYDADRQDAITMRKYYSATSELDLHEEILETGIVLLRWARSLGDRPGWK